MFLCVHPWLLLLHYLFPQLRFEFVGAFDVDAKKVGRDLAEAIVASENNTIKIAALVYAEKPCASIPATFLARRCPASGRVTVAKRREPSQ